MDDLYTPDPLPTGGDAFLDRELQREGWYNSYLLMQSGDDPDVLAEAIGISKRTGVAPELVLGDLDGYREQLRISDTADAMYGTPALSEWLREDPLQRGIGSDDIVSLSGIERFLSTEFGKGVQNVGISSREWAVMLTSGPDLAVLGGDIDTLAAFSKINELEAALAAELGVPVAEIPWEAKNDLWLRAAEEVGIDPTEAGQVISTRFQNLVDYAGSNPERRARLLEEVTGRLASNETTYAAVMSALEAFEQERMSVAGEVPNWSSVETWEDFRKFAAFNLGSGLPTIAATVLSGAVLGPTMGLALAGGGMGYGEIQAELLRAGVAPDEAAAWALLGSVPYAAIERIGAPAVVMRGTNGSEVTQGMFQGAFANWVLRRARGAVRGGAEEYMNEFLQQVTVDVVKDAAGAEELVLDWDKLVELNDAGIAGALTGAVMGSVAPGTSAPRADDTPATPPPVAPVRPPAPVPSPEQVIRYENAGTTAEMLARLDQMATESRTRERDPERFEGFVEKVTGGEQAIYVPGEDLRTYYQEAGADVSELGVDPGALAVAVETGGLVAIPVERYVARVAGTDAAAWFRENAVTDPAREMSLAERSRDGARILAEAQEEVAKVRAELDRLGDSEQRVYDTVRQQLRDAGRTPDVADSEATFFTAFFRSMASRYGEDAYTLFERFAVRVQEGRDTPVDGAVELAQGGALPQRQVDVGGTMLPLNEDGTVTLYHGTTAQGAEAIRAEGRLRSAAEPSVYLTTDPTAAPGYGDGTVVAVNVDPSLLRIDDEFPDGRADFAIDADEVPVAFPTNDPRILYQGERLSARERLEDRGPVRSPRGSTYMGVGEQYTIANPSADAPVLKRNAPLIQASSNAINADQQAEALDALFEKHPDPLASEAAWVDLANDAFSLDRVPMPPFRTIEIVQSGPGAVAEEIKGLSEGMRRDAEAGLATAREFGEVYASGEATPDITAKAFLWSFLSRGVSPYVQEAAFLDAIVSDELTSIMQRATADGWNDALDAEYTAWAAAAIPPGSPGRGTQHNLNAFGRNFMRVMTQRHEDAGGRTGLEIIHGMIADGTPSKLIRREFLKRGSGAGIDNKVVSFTLLLLGRSDVLVLDRVQVRNQWNDGRFDGQNIYDTDTDADGKQVNGSAFAEMTFGHKGLLYYEAMERALQPIIEQAYASIGLEGSLGRYHWDSWLLASNQEVGHASVEGLLRDAQGRSIPYAGAFVRQGKYANYDYGFRYGVLPSGELSTLVEKLDGSGAVIVPYSVMADPKSPARKQISRLASVAKKRGKEYGSVLPWTAALSTEERSTYDEAIAGAGSPAPDLWQYDANAVGRADDAGGRDDAAGQSLDQQQPAGRTLYQRGAGIDVGGPRGGYASAGSTRLEGAPNVAGAAGPDPRLVAVAERYATERGIGLRRQAEFVEIDEDRARRIAQAYEEMPHAPQDPAVREAYQNLIDQTVDQYLALEAAGYQFYFFDPNGPDPYADMEGGFGNPWNAMRDLRANQRMAVYPTADGFGTQEAFDPASNPLLADSGIMWPWGSPDGELRPVTANDLFRAVHDAFGHGLEGAGFRARGEENAWQAHVRLFTGSAIAAITSETRGQNSWLNYGPYGEQNRTAQVQDTIFADQKTGLMPSWTWQEGRAGDMQSQTKEQGDGRAKEERTLYQRGIGPDDLRQDGGGAAGRPQGAPIGTSAEAALGDAQQPVTAADLDRVDDPEFLRGFLQRPGWAVLTATRENLPESIKEARNAEANAYLRSLLEERGIPFVEVTGSYKGEPQGVSFLIIASEDAAVRLGRQFMQESILTSEGLVYAMRPQPVTPATDEIFVGEGAEAMDFFSETPGGTAFSMGLDFGRGPGQPVIPEGYSERADRPQLPIRPDGLVELIHWSDQPLTSVDPAFAGTGPLNGAERRRGARLSFFGVNPRGNVREQGTGYVKESSLGPVEHVAFVDPDRLYPWFEDPAGLVAGKNASEAERAIREAGYLGYYVTEDGSGRAPLGNVAALFDAVPVQVIPAEGRTLQQDDSTKGPRGSIQLPAQGVDRGTTVINLFEGRDLSTVIHEAGHYFYEAFAALASDDRAPQQMKDDLATLQGWMGVEPGKAPSTDAHEKMARGMERYVMEGKAPSPALAAVFGRFKAWLSNIYRTVRGLNVDLNDEVRQVFDRMLATEEEIQQAQSDLAMSPLFAEAPAGMDQTTWETYQKLNRARTEEANRDLLSRKLAEIRRRREAWWKTERDARVTAEMDRLAQDRVYRAVEMLANSRWLGNEDAEIPDVRIDRDALVDMFGEEILKELSPQHFGMTRAIYTTAKHGEGVSPQEAAEIFGFADAEDMVTQLRAAGSRRAIAEANADRQMAEQYGDVLSEDDMRAEALDAAHSDSQADMTVMELRHVMARRGQDTRRATTRAFRLRAQAMIGQMQVRHAQNPDTFLQAERRAAKAAERAFATAARGGARADQALAEAQQAKEQQLLNQFLYAEARDVRALVDRKRTEMRKLERSAETRKRIGSPHIEQIDAILDDYEFRKRSQRQVDRMQSFADYIRQMEADGRIAELTVDEALLAEARRQHYTRLSVDDLRAVFDAVDNIAHMGRRTREVVTARRKRLLDQSAARVADAVRTNQKARDSARSGNVKQFVNLLSRVDTIAVRMDGGKEFGDFHDEIKRDIDEAQIEEQRRTVEGMERLEEIFLRHYTRKELRDMATARNVPGGGVWSKEQIVTMALNTGTESNYQRLLDPRVPERLRLTTQKLDALLGTLDARDWRFVQDVWDFQESFWPELADVEQRRTGVRPKKIEGRAMWPGAPAFVRGGYHRLFYDSDRSGRAAADEEQRSLYEGMSAGWGAKAQVNNGMTKGRMQNANGRPVLLEFSTIPRQMREVVRMITLSEAVDASDRILKHPKVRTAMEDTGNLDTLQTLELWLRDVAAGPLYNVDITNRAARALKNNFTLSRLGFNLKTVVLQVTGLSQASVTIGHKNMVRGLALYARRPLAATEAILAKSPFMQERQGTFQKDIYDFRNSQKTASPVLTGASRVMDVIAKASFWPIVRVQFHMVDVPVWLGAYEGALAEGHTETEAIYRADRMVARSQDSALMADRAGVERGTTGLNTRQSDIVRLFTTLGGYMLTKMNRANVEILRRSMQIREADSPALRVAIAARLAADLTILFAFEAVAIALKYSWLTDEEEPEDVLALIAKETGFAMVGGVPLVRDAAAAFQGFDAGGVYGAGMGSLGKAFIQVQQGEVDDAMLRATFDLVGMGTGLPTTASYRMIEQFVGEDEGSVAEALFGTNPLTR